MKYLRDKTVDYHLLGEAQSFYLRYGYSKIETPWIVSAPISLVTTPMSSNAFILDDGKHLVGSGEQGFIQLMTQDDVITPDKYYQTITPCFRRDVHDEIHCEWFMKLELFLKVEETQAIVAVKKMLADSEIFLDNLQLDIEPVTNGDECCFDLYCGSIELGSYGFRTTTIGEQTFTWAYGTGLALPRVQVCLDNRHNNKLSG